MTVPGLADPRVSGIITDLPDPIRVWSSHDVQVVKVIPWCCDARAVPSVGNQCDVTGVDLFECVDRTSCGCIGTHVTEGLCSSGSIEPSGGRGFEVIDLFEVGLVARDVLVVLVRWVARPVFCGGDDFADNQAVCCQCLRGAKVVYLAARPTGPTEFNWHPLSRNVRHRKMLLGRSFSNRNTTGSGNFCISTCGEVENIGGSVEYGLTSSQYLGV